MANVAADACDEAESESYNDEIVVGTTYEELESWLNSYKQTSFVEFWKRDCRTIAGARNSQEIVIDNQEPDLLSISL